MTDNGTFPRDSLRPLLRALSVGLLLTIALTACTAIQKTLSFIPGIPNPSQTAIRSISLQADSNANQNSAVEVDFLFLLDSGLLKSLPATSPEWFEKRRLLVSNHRAQMLVSSVSLAPGTSARLTMPRGYRKAEDVILYATYVSASGQKWYRVPNVRAAQVRLTNLDPELSDAGG